MEKNNLNVALESLEAEIKTEEKMLAKLRVAHVLEPLKNPRQITVAKRKIARMKTLLHQQKINSKANENTSTKN